MKLSERIAHLKGLGVQGGGIEQMHAEALEMEARLARRPYSDVQEFMDKFRFGSPKVPSKPALATLKLRQQLVREESEELHSALENGDIVQIAAEAIDLLYVTYGALVDCGIEPEPLWEAIHRANMAKERNPTGGKVLKPPGWRKPNIYALVHAQVEEGAQ